MTFTTQLALGSVIVLIFLGGYVYYSYQSKQRRQQQDTAKRQQFLEKQNQIALELSKGMNGMKKSTLEDMSARVMPQIAKRQAVPERPKKRLPNQPARNLSQANNQSANIRTNPPPPPIPPVNSTPGKWQSTQPFAPLVNEEDLGRQLNHYASWVAAHAEKLLLYTHDDQNDIYAIPLLFDTHHVEKMNGHWLHLFRPVEMPTLQSQIETNPSLFTRSFELNMITEINRYAIEILERVESEGEERHYRIIEECGLVDFTEYLENLIELTKDLS